VNTPELYQTDMLNPVRLPGFAYSTFKAYVHVAEAALQNRLGRIPLPRASHFIPTWNCNSRCTVCDIWQRRGQKELDTDGMLKVISRLQCLDILKVVGGEPTMRDDIAELMAAARDRVRPYILQIITNGFQPGRVADIIRAASYQGLHLRISLDGYGEAHNDIRGRKDAFDLVLESIKTATGLRRRYPVRIGINFNVTDRTLPDMPRVENLCRKLKLDFIPGIPVKPFLKPGGHLETEKKTVSLTEKGKAAQVLDTVKMRNKSTYRPLERAFLWFTDRTIFKKLLSKEPSLKFNCLELRSLAYVLPTGDMVTCGLNQEPVGNLYESTLPEIWYGEPMREFRRRVDECPGCLQSAVEILSRLYGGRIF